MKVCSKCKTEKKDSDFFKDSSSPSGLTSYCTVCTNREAKAYRTKAISPRGLSKYGITTIEYELMLERQKGVCKICGEPPSGYKKRLGVDHCHKTHKIRGLLCHDCNLGLGYFKDNPELLERAIKYLRGDL